MSRRRSTGHDDVATAREELTAIERRLTALASARAEIEQTESALRKMSERIRQLLARQSPGGSEVGS